MVPIFEPKDVLRFEIAVAEGRASLLDDRFSVFQSVRRFPPWLPESIRLLKHTGLPFPVIGHRLPLFLICGLEFFDGEITTKVRNDRFLWVIKVSRVDSVLDNLTE